MTWTTPRTWIANEMVRVAYFNTDVRDNLLQTFPALAQTAGDLFYASAANTPARLAAPTLPVGPGSAQYLRQGSAGTPVWRGYRLYGGTGDIFVPTGSGGTPGTIPYLQVPIPASATLHYQYMAMIRDTTGNGGAQANLDAYLTISSGGEINNVGHSMYVQDGLTTVHNVSNGTAGTSISVPLLPASHAGGGGTQVSIGYGQGRVKGGSAQGTLSLFLGSGTGVSAWLMKQSFLRLSDFAP